MKKLLFIALLLSLTTAVQAQRYGHLNFSGLIAIMPEAASAESELQALNDELVAEGEAKLAVLEADYKVFQEAQATTAPVELQRMAEALQAQQQGLANFEQEAAQQLEAKRGELLEPVVTRAQQAVEDVAKENNFLLVFDTGTFNAILFADETEDLMPLVKAKLGLE